jgi:hypothetical protein
MSAILEMLHKGSIDQVHLAVVQVEVCGGIVVLSYLDIVVEYTPGEVKGTFQPTPYLVLGTHHVYGVCYAISHVLLLVAVYVCIITAFG